jgi:N-acyl-D-amino-acid deacylase
MVDILIKNGVVVDGTGKPSIRTDIAIKGGKVWRISDTINLEAKRTINASGKIVSPGFIDYHSHGDSYFLFGTDAYNLLEQGVTTEITGHCGSGIVPYYEGMLDDAKEMVPKELFEHVKSVTQNFKSFEAIASNTKMGTNMAFYAGHGNIRARVMGFSDDCPTLDQMNEMKSWIKDAMDCGFLGISTGLIYPPSIYANQEELTELAREVALFDGSYASHIRGESDTVVEAVIEAIAIGEDSGCNVVISHHKIGGKQNAGKSKITLHLIEKANERGKIQVRTDQYPFLAGHTSLIAALPATFASEGMSVLIENLKDKEFRSKVTEKLESKDLEQSLLRDSGFAGCLVLTAPKTPDIVGKNIAEIAVERGTDPYETVYDLIIENNGNVGMAYFYQNAEDMMNILKKPYVMVGADSGHNIQHYDNETTGGGHPRSMSTFTKHLRIVREQKILTLEDAIKRITSLPAETAKLDNVGVLKEGYNADICIFDWNKISDTNDYLHPFRKNSGIEYVIVNGQVVVEEGNYNGVKAGKMLKRRMIESHYR